MKRYLAFAGESYYPGGGWADFVGDFDTLEEAKAAALAQKTDWEQVVDTRTKQIVWSGNLFGNEIFN